MFCPRCGQEQISDVTRFCSRCGFLLTGTAVVLSNDGTLPQTASQPASANSPRKRGLKQGLFIFLLTFLLVPLVAIISKGLDITPVFVAITAIVLPVGGLLRMAYALMFESSVGIDGGVGVLPGMDPRTLQGGQPNVLPPQQSIPASDYISPPAGNWRDTKNLNIPASVTEETTKLLQKEQDQ
jgi:hypothetical protein